MSTSRAAAAVWCTLFWRCRRCCMIHVIVSGSADEDLPPDFVGRRFERLSVADLGQEEVLARLSARPLFGQSPVFVVDGLLDLDVDLLRQASGADVVCVTPRLSQHASQKLRTLQDVCRVHTRARSDRVGGLSAEFQIPFDKEAEQLLRSLADHAVRDVFAAASLAGLARLDGRTASILAGSRLVRPTPNDFAAAVRSGDLRRVWELSQQVEPIPSWAQAGAMLAGLRSDVRDPTFEPGAVERALALWVEGDGRVKASADPSDMLARLGLRLTLVLHGPSADSPV